MKTSFCLWKEIEKYAKIGFHGHFWLSREKNAPPTPPLRNGNFTSKTFRWNFVMKIHEISYMNYRTRKLQLLIFYKFRKNWKKHKKKNRFQIGRPRHSRGEENTVKSINTIFILNFNSKTLIVKLRISWLSVKVT